MKIYTVIELYLRLWIVHMIYSGLTCSRSDKQTFRIGRLVQSLKVLLLFVTLVMSFLIFFVFFFVKFETYPKIVLPY